MDKDLEGVYRFLSIEQPVTGTQIIKALKQIAESEKNFKYYEQEVLDIEGKPILKVGLLDEGPYCSVVVGTGVNLVNNWVRINKSYNNVGIQSTSWPERCQAYYVNDAKNNVVIPNLEKVANQLEKLLNR